MRQTPIARRHAAGVALLAGAIVLAACGGDGEGGLRGEIDIDGSSTVFPISQAVAEDFHKEHPGARISVGLSGTGGGFDKLCRGEIQISNASRPIEPDEVEACRANGIAVTELSVAADGLSIVVHPDNDWVDCLTIEQLHQIWKPESTVERWSDLDPAWPDEKMRLFGPGTDSGTFDYFTETINGAAGASRADYAASEDDNVLVQGVEGDEHALAYLGFAYYVENQERLKVLAVDGGAGCVTPAPDTVRDSTYAPLSRPLFVYVNNAALVPSQPDARPTTLAAGATPVTESIVAAFLRYYLIEGPEIIPFIGYVPLDPAVYAEQLRKLDAATSDESCGTRDPGIG
jgi:phosphate transport system substrate-binding protein